MIVCQMTKYLIFQTDRCYIVVLIDGMNQWNYVMWLIADFLPEPRVQASQMSVHISYFLQNCKKGKPSEMNLPYLKTISQVLNPLLK